MSAQAPKASLDIERVRNGGRTNATTAEAPPRTKFAAAFFRTSSFSRRVVTLGRTRSLLLKQISDFDSGQPSRASHNAQVLNYNRRPEVDGVVPCKFSE